MKTFRLFQWDLAGISVSALCTLHCVVLPVVMSSFPVWGIAVLENPWLEALLIGLAFVSGLIAFYKGCFVLHKRKEPLLLFCFGFLLLLANQWNEHLTFYVIPIASAAIITAHIINYRYGKKRKSCVVPATAKSTAVNNKATLSPVINHKRN